MQFSKPSQSQLSAVDEIFRVYHASNPSPGMVYAVGFDASIIHDGAIGYRRRDNSPVNRHTAFRIASMTKSFAAAAILSLRDAGKLSLAAPVCELIRQSHVHPALQNLTVRHLLGMRAGLPSDDPWADRTLPDSNEIVSKYFAARPLTISPPGTAAVYSNLGYMLLGRIISEVSGTDARDFIMQTFCVPLALHDTKWNLEDSNEENAAEGYSLHRGTWTIESVLQTANDGAVFGGLWSTLADITRWISFLSGDAHDTNGTFEEILPQATCREMISSASPYRVNLLRTHPYGQVLRVDASYGFGLISSRIGDQFHIAHSGGLPGFGSHMRYDKHSKITIVAFANSTYAQMHKPCATALEFLGREAAAHSITNSASAELAASQLLALFEQWTNSTAREIFQSNVFLDSPGSELRDLFQSSSAQVQAPFRRKLLFSSNAATSELRIAGSAGEAVLTFSFAPTDGSKIQRIAIAVVLVLSPHAQSVIRWFEQAMFAGSEKIVDNVARCPARLEESSGLTVVTLSIHLGKVERVDLLESDGVHFVVIRAKGAGCTSRVRFALSEVAVKITAE